MCVFAMSDTISFLHTADFHLGAKFSFLPPVLSKKRRQDIRNNIAAVVDIAIGKKNLDHKVDLLLLSGDVFDSAKPSAADSAFFRFQLERLQKHQVQVFLISGNHDWYEQGNFWDKERFPLTRHFTAYDFELYEDFEKDITIMGMAFDRKRTSINHLADFDFKPQTSRSILLYHGAWENQGIQYTRDYPFRTEDLEKLQANYCALGHYHSLTKVLDQRKKKAYYAGTLEGLDFSAGELGKRFVIRGELDIHGDVSLVPIEINSMEMERLEYDVSTFSQTQLITEIQKRASSFRLLQVILTGIPPVDSLVSLARLQEEFEPQFAFLDIKDETLELPKDLPEQEQTYIGLYAKRMHEHINAASDEKEKKLYKKALQYGLVAALSKK